MEFGDVAEPGRSYQTVKCHSFFFLISLNEAKPLIKTIFINTKHLISP